jgi:hypothetical protein
MVIDVAKMCGEDLISRDAGRKVREMMLASWHEAEIELRFSGHTVGSVSFFDEAVGLLLKRDKKTIEEVRRKLKFPDLLPPDRMLLNHVVEVRIQEQRVKRS